jgi:hypothetical protein
MESTWRHCLRLHLQLPFQELHSAKCPNWVYSIQPCGNHGNICDCWMEIIQQLMCMYYYTHRNFPYVLWINVILITFKHEYHVVACDLLENVQINNQYI